MTPGLVDPTTILHPYSDLQNLGYPRNNSNILSVHFELKNDLEEEENGNGDSRV